MKRALLLLLLAVLPEAAAAPPEGNVVLTGTVFLAGDRASDVAVEVRRRPGDTPAVPLWADARDDLHPERFVESPLPSGPAVASVRTDEEGRYAVAGLEPGRYVVVATAADGSRGWSEIPVLQDGERPEVDVSVLGGPLTVRGRARYRDGSAFAGLVVLSAGEYDAGAAAADGEGRFEIPGLVPGSFELTAVVPGRLRVSLGPMLCPAEGPLDLVVDEDLASSRGRVVDPSGAPVAGALVVALGGGYVEGGERIVAAARTDEEGRFELLGPLDPEFRIVAPDRWLPWLEPRGPADGDLLLVARPRPRIRGVVRRAEDGAPLAGVPVLARSRDGRAAPVATISDEEGRFELAAPDRHVDFAAWGGGWVPADLSDEALSLELGAGETREVDPRVVPAARFEGRVVKGPGEPVAGAEVALGFGLRSLRGEDSPANRILGAFPRPLTDANGRFSINRLPVGWEIDFAVRAGRLRAGEGKFRGSEEEEVEVTVYWMATKLSTARVRFPPGASPTDLRGLPRGHRPGPDGLFRFWHVWPDTLLYVAWFGDVFHRAEAVFAPGDERDIRFEPAPAAHAWLVHVLDPEGRPVPRGRCTFTHGDGGDAWDLGFERGRAWFFGDPGPGRAAAPDRWLDLHSFRDARGRPLPYAPLRAGPFPAGISTVRLSPGRTVIGGVTTPDGLPVRGARIEARQILDDRDRSGTVHAEARSGVDGRFRLVGLAEAPYEIRVSAPRAFVDPAPATLASDAEELTVRVVPKAAARIRVLSPEGGPVAGAAVRFEAPGRGGPFEDGRILRTTDGEGVAVFPLLPPDLPVALRVTPPGDGFLPHADPHARPADATVVLARAFSLSGQVLDAAGRPVPDATVFLRAAAGAPALPGDFSWHRIEGGFLLAAIADADGRFEVRGLPETRLTVFAVRVREDGREERSPTAETPSGATGIVLRLPPPR